LSGSIKLRLDGEKVKSIAALAGVLPIQLLHAESFRLLQAPPKIRRQFLDWAVFHVEPSFFMLWKKYYQLLKHRNALLRQSARYEQLKAWDISLIEVAGELDILRKRVFSAWLPLIEQVVLKLFPAKPVSITYSRGWDGEKGLEEVLEGAYFRDNAVQYTQYGPHRADLQIKVAGTPAQHRLSIGQQKMLISSLYIAQGLLLKANTGKSCLYLIDDLPAELDKDWFDIVVCGDVHKPQAVDGITKSVGIYCGAPMQHDMGDADSNRGFLLVKLREAIQEKT